MHWQLFFVRVDVPVIRYKQREKAVGFCDQRLMKYRPTMQINIPVTLFAVRDS